MPVETADERPAPKPRRRVPLSLLLAVAGIVFLIWAVASSDPREALREAAGIPARSIAAVVACVGAAYVLRFAKWHYFVTRLGLQVGAGRSAAIFAAGLLMVMTPAKVGEVWKAIALQESESIPLGRSVPAVALERLTDLLAIVALAVLAAAPLGFAPWLAALSIVVLAVGILLLRWPKPWHAAVGFLDRRDPTSRLAGFLRPLHEGTRALLAPRPLAVGGAIGIVAWGLEGYAFHLILAGLGVEASALWAIGVFSVGTLAGALSFLPGGLGTTEAGMVALLVAGGVGESTALAATVLVRLLTLGLGAALGAIAFAAWSARRRAPVTPNQ